MQMPMEETPSNSELHELFDGRLKLYQPARGYRFSIDALLLAVFARGRCAGSVADLGTGCGVLPLLLARRDEVVHVTAVEIQQELAGLARRNSELNGCSEKITVLCGDVRAIGKMAPPESFDAVVTNPPFYPVASGRINPMAQKAAARHEVHGSLDDFHCGRLVSFEAGRQMHGRLQRIPACRPACRPEKEKPGAQNASVRACPQR